MKLLDAVALLVEATGWSVDDKDVRLSCGQVNTVVEDAEGAVEVYHDLVATGYELVRVTAMEIRFEAASPRSLQGHGFPVSRVIAAPNALSGDSLKAAPLWALSPVRFGMTICSICSELPTTFTRRSCYANRTAPRAGEAEWNTRIRGMRTLQIHEVVIERTVIGRS